MEESVLWVLWSQIWRIILYSLFQGPVVTDNGGLILDWKFVPDKDMNWTELGAKLSQIPGKPP